MFTTRQLRFREPTVEDDYARVAEAFSVPTSAVVRVRQVHGGVVHVASSHVEHQVIDADAVVITSRTLVASVRVADCVPVLMADTANHLVAAVHAGWRGTAAGVVAETVRAIAALGVPAERLVAVVGPSIGPCCYQVGANVHDEMHAVWPNAGGWFVSDEDRWRLDLWRANRDQLVSAGVLAANVHVAGLCTAHGLDRWYSHRQEGAETGRMVAAIALTP